MHTQQMNLQAPSSKLQRNLKRQCPKAAWLQGPALLVEICDLELLWSLVFGAWSF